MTRRAATAASAVLMAWAVGTRAAAADTYVGTVAIAQADGKAVSVPLTVTIREYTSDSRANRLALLLNDQGHAAAASELAKDDIGQVQLGDGASFRLTLARQEPREKGQVLRMVTERPMYVVAKPPVPAPPADALGYLELTLDSAGTGEGRLMPAVRAKFDADGFVAPDNVGGATWTVSGLTKKP